MVIMAINPNSARKAQHTSISMLTGGGKGIAINNLKLIDPRHPVVIFDPHGEYDKIAGRKVYAYKTKRNFCKVFAKAWASGKPFALAYRPQIKTQDEKARRKELKAHAHWFGRLVWEASDGNRILYAIFEEYGEYCDSAANDDSIIGTIWTGGRKFGIRAFAIFQRSANVAKNVWENSPNKVIGVQGGINDRERVIKELRCSVDDVNDLDYRNEALEMYHKNFDEHVKTKVHYLVSKGGSFEKVACYVPQNAALRKKWTAKQRDIDKQGGYRIAA